MGADTFTVKIGSRSYAVPVPTRRAFGKWGRMLERVGPQIYRTGENSGGGDLVERDDYRRRKTVGVLRAIGVRITMADIKNVPFEDLYPAVTRIGVEISNKLGLVGMEQAIGVATEAISRGGIDFLKHSSAIERAARRKKRG